MFQGGIVARGLFALPDFDSAMVNTIITQATPHQKPGMLKKIPSRFLVKPERYVLISSLVLTYESEGKTCKLEALNYDRDH